MRARVRAITDSSRGAAVPPVIATIKAQRETPRAPSIITAWRIEVILLAHPEVRRVDVAQQLDAEAEVAVDDPLELVDARLEPCTCAAAESVLSAPTGTSRTSVVRRAGEERAREQAKADELGPLVVLRGAQADRPWAAHARRSPRPPRRSGRAAPRRWDRTRRSRTGRAAPHRARGREVIQREGIAAAAQRLEDRTQRSGRRPARGRRAGRRGQGAPAAPRAWPGARARSADGERRRRRAPRARRC